MRIGLCVRQKYLWVKEILVTNKLLVATLEGQQRTLKKGCLEGLALFSLLWSVIIDFKKLAT